MLTVTKSAVELLKAAKAAEGATDHAGIRIRRGAVDNEPGTKVALAFTEDPDPEDEEFEEEGLRIFIEDALVEPLDGQTLDVLDGGEGPELVFR